MKRQSAISQLGEIEFRRKLVRQQVNGENLLDDEFDRTGIETILRERMNTTLDQMTALRERGFALSPYVEIGAERSQRSLVMENEIEAEGAATDISYDMLKSCDYYRSVFNKRKIPLRVCCDANNLPFETNSLPFVFCYQTIHHFPDPTPIIAEAHRVLCPGGRFLFAEEPYRNILHINLYRGRKIYSGRSLQRSRLRRAIDHFFCEATCNEVEHGILENHDIPVSSWQRALAPFSEKDVDLVSARRIRSKAFEPPSRVKYLITLLLGGSIAGVCRKAGVYTPSSRSILQLLICPTCRQLGREVSLGLRDAALSCIQCQSRFPTVSGVLFLLSRGKLAELYPDVVRDLNSEKDA